MFPLLRIQRNRTTFCACFRHVSAKGNKCFRNRNSEFTFAETHENVAEMCLFHVSVDVFRTTECVMESAETQETIRKLMSVLCFRYPSLVSSHKRDFFSKLSSTCGNYYCSSKHFYFLLRPETAPLLCA